MKRAFFIPLLSRAREQAVSSSALRKLLLVFIPCCLALAQSGLTPPRVGWLLDNGNRPRPVEGVAGNFWLGNAADDEAVSIGSSGAATMLKTPSEVIVLDAQGHVASRFRAPDGSAQFAFTTSGSPALAWFSQARELAYFQGPRLRRVPVNPSMLGGGVIALAESSTTRATLLIERERAISRVSVDLHTGLVRFETGLPGLHSPAYLAPDGTILALGDDDLVVRHPGGADIRLPFPLKPASFAPFGNGWVLAQSAPPEHPYAILIAPSREQVFQLPEAQK